jgi:hypothetical protein
MGAAIRYLNFQKFFEEPSSAGQVAGLMFFARGAVVSQRRNKNMAELGIKRVETNCIV